MNDTPQPATTLQLTKPLTHDEAATVLAALRLFQAIRAGHATLLTVNCREWPPHHITAANVETELEHFEDARPLDVTELDALCEAINLQPIHPQRTVYPVVIGGVLDYICGLQSGESFETIDLDDLKAANPREAWEGLSEGARAALYGVDADFAGDLEAASKTGTPDARRAAALKIIENEAAYTVNGYELPNPVPRYLVEEVDSDDDGIWYYNAETMDEAARAILNSDTERVSCTRVYDLDTGEQFTPTMAVMGWQKAEQQK